MDITLLRPHSLAVFIFSVFFTLNVHAIIIDNGTYTTDTQTGLDWYDVTLTLDRSYLDVKSNLASGGDFEGWRYATSAEFNELVANFTGELVNSTGKTRQEPDRIDSLIDLLGDTLGLNQGIKYTRGLLDEPLNSGNYTAIYDAILWSDDRGTSSYYDDFSNGHYTYWYDWQSHQYLGSFLVRNTKSTGALPEPSVIILFILGIISILMIRRKLSTNYDGHKWS